MFATWNKGDKSSLGSSKFPPLVLLQAAEGTLLLPDPEFVETIPGKSGLFLTTSDLTCSGVRNASHIIINEDA
uniref:Uncharacterized protein n=1 Tax=Caenorhabditis japonica TaxID=281687 RepID=A0A8R1E2Q8_CAEJA